MLKNLACVHSSTTAALLQTDSRVQKELRATILAKWYFHSNCQMLTLFHGKKRFPLVKAVKFSKNLGLRFGGAKDLAAYMKVDRHCTQNVSFAVCSLIPPCVAD